MKNTSSIKQNDIHVSVLSHSHSSFIKVFKCSKERVCNNWALARGVWTGGEEVPTPGRMDKVGDNTLTSS